MSTMRRRALFAGLCFHLLLLGATCEGAGQHPNWLKRGQVSRRILVHSIERGMKTDEPFPLAVDIARSAVRAHGTNSLPILSRLLDAALVPTNAPTRIDLFVVIAESAAAYDLSLRDRALRAASSLRLDESDDLRARQRELDRELCEVMVSGDDVADVVKRISAVVAEGKSIRGTGCQAPDHYGWRLLWTVARLDPEALIAAWKPEYGDLAAFCYRQADHIQNSVYFAPNRISKRLIMYAFKNGRRDYDALRLLKHYDTKAAYEEAMTFPETDTRQISPRTRARIDVLTHWAWSDPATALRLAESEEDFRQRKYILPAVANVIAYSHPGSVNRAILNVTDKRLADVALRIARRELERREAGQPPTVSAAMARHAPRAMVHKNPPPLSESERTNRFEEMLGRLSERGSDRSYTLSELFRYDSERAVKVLREVSGDDNLSRELSRLVIYMGAKSDQSVAVHTLTRIKDDALFVKTACALSVSLMRDQPYRLFE